MLLGKHINKYYVKYAIFFIIGIVALILVDVAQLYEPQFLGNMVDLLSDGVVSEDDKIKIIRIIVYTLSLAGVMMLGRVLWRLTIFHGSFKIEAELRKEMFTKAEKLSQRYYHANKVGGVMAWFTNDIETIQEYTGWGTIMLVDACFLAVLVIVQMFILEPILSLIAIVPILLIVVWGALVEKFMSMKWEARQQSFDNLYDFSQETFTGIRVIKAFVKETQQLHAYAKLARKDKDVNVDFARVSVLFDVIIEIIIAIIFAIIMGFGGWFVYSFVTGNPVVIFGHEVKLGAGQLVTFTGYFDLLIWPMIAMGQIVSMHSRAKTSLKRISKFLDEEEEIHDKENAIDLKEVRGGIVFKDFSFQYPEGSSPYLKHISLEIKEGETIGIVGRIGSGKTTLANSLLRLYNVNEGQVFIDGNDLMDCSIKSIRDNIAYVPQDNFLFSDTVEHNIGFSNKNLPSEKIVEAAKFSDVHKDIKDFKVGYKTITGERGVALSGGQKQRISIARAYVKDAPIMILDDSVSAVDVKTEEMILKNISNLRKGKTTLVVASRVSTVSHLDRIIVLDNGELEAFGTHKELLNTSPTYKKMVYLQELEKEVEGGN